jgi:hypothetical protein
VKQDDGVFDGENKVIFSNNWFDGREMNLIE